jgi:hypothetical protein
MTNQMTMEILTSTGPIVWTDISDDVYQRDPLTITRGKSDEQSQAAPQRMSFTLDNRDGRYSPRNPLSPLFGKIGRNTPIRCKIDNGTSQRFYGEISSFPPRWDEGHADNYVPIEAYGVLRRLGQGQPPLSNALRDWVLQQPTLAAYYPLSGGEDTKYSQNIAPGKTGSFFGSGGAAFTYGVDMGAAWLGTGMQVNATGDVPYLQGVGNAMGSNAALDFTFSSLAMGVLDVQLWPTSDSYWNLRLNTSADACTAQVWYYDDTAGILAETATGVITELRDTELHTCRFELDTVAGPNVSYKVYIDGVQIDTGTNSLGQTLARVPFFRFHYSRFVNQTYVNLAHLVLWADNTAANIPLVQDYTAAAFAYAGEFALDRIFRVAADGDVFVDVFGNSDESSTMGPQFTESRLDQIRDCETTDMGILTDSRVDTFVVPTLNYIARSGMYNQSTWFTLNYNAGQVVAPLEPIDDDQTTRNDVTATRREGGSARYAIDTGPLSTQDPPHGVGHYDTEVTVNVQTDGQLLGIASWVANFGTLDKARWPSVTVNLNAPGMNSILRAKILSADIGKQFTITGMQKAFIYDDVSLVIVGYTEVIDPFVHTITFNCMPAEPFMVAEYGTARYDADGSTVTSNITATATSLSATKSGTTLWTTDPTAFPFDIRVGGERMTVTNITGSTSPQTMTVVRSKNSVVKAQTSGTAIALWNTPRYAL